LNLEENVLDQFENSIELTLVELAEHPIGIFFFSVATFI
jgi:hypothetical protein